MSSQIRDCEKIKHTLIGSSKAVMRTIRVIEKRSQRESNNNVESSISYSSPDSSTQTGQPSP